MALELSAIVGMALMAVGTLMVLWGLVLCYTTKVVATCCCPGWRIYSGVDYDFKLNLFLYVRIWSWF